MLNLEMLHKYSDEELIGLISKLDMITEIMGTHPQSNGKRWQQLCQIELQRRRNRKRPFKATVREER
jgi:hypothetical protein